MTDLKYIYMYIYPENYGLTRIYSGINLNISLFLIKPQTVNIQTLINYNTKKLEFRRLAND